MLGASYDKAAVRRTRQDLASHVRNDWEAVLARALKKDRTENNSPDEHADASSLNESVEDLIHPPSTPREWRERTYASSDPSSSELSEGDTPNRYPTDGSHRRKPSATGRLSHGQRAYLGHHCMFPDGSDGDAGSSTDSSGLKRPIDADAVRKQERKRRRRRRLEEEMTWNEGLRNWEQTRDIWCRAKRVPLPEQQQRQSEQKEAAQSQEGTESSGSATTSTATSVEEDVQANMAELKPFSQRSVPSPSPVPPDDNDRRPPSSPASCSIQSTALLPLAHPLIPPTDPGRQNIKAQYSLIYAKIVTEGLRPQVPINLSHMIPALVRGWKANDEWPPKGTTATVREGEVKGVKAQRGQRQRPADRDAKGASRSSPKVQGASNRRTSGAGAAFEGLKEGGRRLFGITTNRSSPKAEGQKDEGPQSPKSPKSQSSQKLPISQTSPKFNDPDTRRKADQLIITTNHKSVETTDTANGAPLYEREVLGSKGQEPEMPPHDSPRASTESTEKDEKKSPLKMRKNVKMVGRRIRNSLGGGTGSGGSSG